MEDLNTLALEKENGESSMTFLDGGDEDSKLVMETSTIVDGVTKLSNLTVTIMHT